MITPAPPPITTALLREAAALMRSRAEGVQMGPWEIHEEHGSDFTGEGWSNLSVDGADGKSVAWYCDEQEGIESAEHIASWHPAVALAVADWLDATADMEAAVDAACRCWRCKQIRGATAVAAAYLGRQL